MEWVNVQIQKNHQNKSREEKKKSTDREFTQFEHVLSVAHD